MAVSLVDQLARSRNSKAANQYWWTCFVLHRQYSIENSLANVDVPISLRPDASNMDSHGIFPFCVRLYDIWYKAMAFVREAKRRRAADAWLASSTYQSIITDLFEFDRQMPDRHRLQNTRFHELTPEQVQVDKDYWLFWLSMSLLYHGILVLVNHPVLHVSTGQGFQARGPSSFKQQTVEHALLHAKWVARLYEMNIALCLRSTDPFLMHILCMSASAVLFFVQSNDIDTRNDAQQTCEQCLATVSDMTLTWPHLSHTVSYPRNTSARADVLSTGRGTSHGNE